MTNTIDNLTVEMMSGNVSQTWVEGGRRFKREAGLVWVWVDMDLDTMTAGHWVQL